MLQGNYQPMGDLSSVYIQPSSIPQVGKIEDHSKVFRQDLPQKTHFSDNPNYTL
jgi:hypothetical protein